MYFFWTTQYKFGPTHKYIPNPLYKKTLSWIRIYYIVRAPILTLSLLEMGLLPSGALFYILDLTVHPI